MLTKNSDKKQKKKKEFGKKGCQKCTIVLECYVVKFVFFIDIILINMMEDLK